MEKLQKALEKAQRQPQPLSRHRAAKAARPEPSPGQSETAPEPTADVAQNAVHSASDESTQVAYTRTRVTQTTSRALEKRRLIAADPEHPLTDVFKVLRTRILHRMDAAGFQTLGLVGTRREEGKSLVACNLAISLSQLLNRTVLLVDLDFRAPSIHSYFGIDPRPGLNAYLTGNADIADCLVNPGIERLVLLPTAEPISNSSEVLAGPRMRNLSKELRQQYTDRLIVYDLPPVLAGDDALSFLQQAECGLLVASEGATTENDLQKAMDLLEGYPIVGTVLNRSSERPSRYYGHGY